MPRPWKVIAILVCIERCFDIASAPPSALTLSRRTSSVERAGGSLAGAAVPPSGLRAPPGEGVAAAEAPGAGAARVGPVAAGGPARAGRGGPTVTRRIARPTAQAATEASRRTWPRRAASGGGRDEGARFIVGECWDAVASGVKDSGRHALFR